MADDPDSSHEQRSWFERIGAALSGEPTTREDVLDFLRDAHGEGVLGADSLRMMEGAIAIADMTVADAMVPRAQVTMLSVDDDMDTVLAAVLESGHSRYPVHGEDKDQILGILIAKDLLRVVCERTGQQVKELLRPAFLVPESKRLDVLLREFRLSRNHMGVVIDEYGGVAGLITIEDVLEQIVGEIDDEHDEADASPAHIRSAADGHYVVEALTPIADFNTRFQADFADDEYDTIGGLVVNAFGQLPETGEEVTLGRFTFRVGDADARRVHNFHVGVAG